MRTDSKGPLDLARITPDRVAPFLEHGDLATRLLDVTAEIPDIRVLGNRLRSVLLFAAAADQERQAALDRRWIVQDLTRGVLVSTCRWQRGPLSINVISSAASSSQRRRSPGLAPNGTPNDRVLRLEPATAQPEDRTPFGHVSSAVICLTITAGNRNVFAATIAPRRARRVIARPAGEGHHRREDRAGRVRADRDKVVPRPDVVVAEGVRKAPCPHQLGPGCELRPDEHTRPDNPAPRRAVRGLGLRAPHGVSHHVGATAGEASGAGVTAGRHPDVHGDEMGTLAVGEVTGPRWQGSRRSGAQARGQSRGRRADAAPGPRAPGPLARGWPRPPSPPGLPRRDRSVQ